MNIQDENTELVAEAESQQRLRVVEVFGPTIQGEGPLIGTKTMFVRFAGCDFRCKMCDSLHAVDPKAIKKHARFVTEDELVDELMTLRGTSGTPWVTLSGGNPALWNLDGLVDKLHRAGLGVAVETQGTIFKPWMRKVQCLVISPKGPGMGEKCDVEKLLDVLRGVRLGEGSWVGDNVVIKVVVFSAQDMEFAHDLKVAIDAASPVQLVPDGGWFMSVGNSMPPELTENYDLDGELESDIPGLPGAQSHKLDLLEAYQISLEDFQRDGRFVHWRFLPQLHVLVYSNEAEK